MPAVCTDDILIFLGSKHSYDIYKYTRMALDPATGRQYTRYEMPRAALMLLAKHGAQFAPYLLDEYEVRTTYVT